MIEATDGDADAEGRALLEAVGVAKTLEIPAGAVLDRAKVPVTDAVDGAPLAVAVFS